MHLKFDYSFVMMCVTLIVLMFWILLHIEDTMQEVSNSFQLEELE